MRKRILLVEDDPASLRLTQYTLEQGGYEVLTAITGLEGLKKAQSESPDLVILDVMLPGMEGFDICYYLRAEPQTARLPILMLSAKAREADRDVGLKAGADDYLVKPISPSEILSRVESWLVKEKRGLPVQEKKVEQR
jgi:two-component system alkaline phosphatase synthesis response regulator PhoP